MNERLIEKYRDINVSHEWWDCVYDDYVHTLENKGFTTSTDQICFSGFWSQGDGASFTGRIFGEDMADFMTQHGLAERYPSAYFFAQHKDLYVRCESSSNHYCHEHTVCISLHEQLSNSYDEDDPRGDIYEAMTQNFNNKEFHELEAEIAEILRGYMRSLYYDLRTEYEYLTSDEAVWETIQANDLITDEEEEDGVCCN